MSFFANTSRVHIQAASYPTFPIENIVLSNEFSAEREPRKYWLQPSLKPLMGSFLKRSPLSTIIYCRFSMAIERLPCS